MFNTCQASSRLYRLTYFVTIAQNLLLEMFIVTIDRVGVTLYDVSSFCIVNPFDVCLPWGNLLDPFVRVVVSAWPTRRTRAHEWLFKDLLCHYLHTNQSKNVHGGQTNGSALLGSSIKVEGKHRAAKSHNSHRNVYQQCSCGNVRHISIRFHSSLDCSSCPSH